MTTLDLETLRFFGQLLEYAEELHDRNSYLLDEDAAEHERRCFDKLWAHYEELAG